jgi:N-acetylmuramoyl-L-alanine amidase
MRRAAIIGAALIWAPAATAAPPSVAASASPATGAAPLTVTLTASGDAASYSWDLGDGTSAIGPVVQHTYRPGAFVARVTATGTTGESAQATVRIASYALTLRSRRAATYGGHLRFRGRLVPAIRGVRVRLYRAGARIASGRTKAGGIFTIGAPIRAPGAYEARFGGAVSNPLAIRVRPRIGIRFRDGAVLVRAFPARAGLLRVRIARGARALRRATTSGRLRVRIPRESGGVLRVRATIEPAPGFLRAAKRLRKLLYLPALAPGTSGPSVRELERRLWDLGFALGWVDSYYGRDTTDAVIAFQKLYGLPRTGRLDSHTARLLTRAERPRARYGGSHVEVDKGRQVLLVVRDGHVVLVVHVSTGATGNTPVGLWHVYSKAAGWNASSMYDSSYFLRGFAIHGYPSVPVYPASHGCVRVPVWVAPRLFSLIHYGTAIYIY